MMLKTVFDSAYLPPEIVEQKRKHFQDVFGKFWKSVYDESADLLPGEETLVICSGGRTAGWLQFQKSDYYLKFRNFTVCPDFRGQGIARQLMQELEKAALRHHEELLASGKKPADIKLMFLKSMVYLDAGCEGEAFAFGKFLKKFGFLPCPYNKNDVSKEEAAGISAYQKIYPEFSSCLKVFKKPVADGGVELKSETKAELLRLSPQEWEITMAGLRVKLSNYQRSGRVSYRYDLCPICAFMGSSEQNDKNCGRCFIRQTCFEPFREPGRFKEDYEVSGAYFEAVRQFLLTHKPEASR